MQIYIYIRIYIYIYIYIHTYIYKYIYIYISGAQLVTVAGYHHGARLVVSMPSCDALCCCHVTRATVPGPRQSRSIPGRGYIYAGYLPRVTPRRKAIVVAIVSLPDRRRPRPRSFTTNSINTAGQWCVYGNDYRNVPSNLSIINNPTP